MFSFIVELYLNQYNVVNFMEDFMENLKRSVANDK